MNKNSQQELLEIVRNNYEEIAEDFATTRKKILWPTLIEYANEVQMGESVLDVGSGSSRLLRFFEGKKIKYVGVDNSQNLIEGARKAFEVGLFDVDNKPEFKVGNILELDKLKIGQFNWIFCIAVLHHLPSAELQLKALLNLKEHLAENGKIVLSVWRPWGNKRLVKILLKTIWLKIIGRHAYQWNDLVFEWKNNKSPRYYHFFTNHELKQLIKATGLELMELRKEKRNFYLVLK